MGEFFWDSEHFHLSVEGGQNTKIYFYSGPRHTELLKKGCQNVKAFYLSICDIVQKEVLKVAQHYSSVHCPRLI